MKLKGIMAAAVTVAMVSSCIHIPITTAQAQTLLSNMTADAVQMDEAEISAATEDISELEGDYGVVNIVNGRESKISFVTDETGYYEIILQGSQSRLMLQETLYNSKSKRLATGKRMAVDAAGWYTSALRGRNTFLGLSMPVLIQFPKVQI